MGMISASSLMMTSEGINRSINQLVALQTKPNAPQLLEKLGMSIVDVNRTINLLGEYDKVIEHVLRITNAEWPPDVGRLSEEVNLWSS